MKIKDLRTVFVDHLKDIYPLEEIQSFFQITAQHFLNYNRTDIVLHLDQELSKLEVQCFQDTLHRLKKEEPIQYILGNTEFYGLPFIVTKDTLIPRPETEELVAWVIEEYTSYKSDLQILDIGTGSGCIAISLARHLESASVYAYDISESAIEVAIQNATHNKVVVQYNIVDILQTKTLTKSFDVIVSNPPYVRELEKEEMKPNVLDNEPHTALFVSNIDPLIFYRKIGQLAFDNLSLGGSLFFEINQYLSMETKQLLHEIGFMEVIIRKDMFGNDRMVKAVR